ncbi:hypothetical protein BKA83DRAFT_4603427 [Pisolithus microcarpus]|nr:hypothetical protein BKA83DRAFT_4603427 [Pisolithus microcarpus]
MRDLDHVDGDASAYYFTLRTGKHDMVELRSFLYLDLANSSVKSIAGQTLRGRQQTSHRRKTSVSSRSTSWTFCTSGMSVNTDSRHEKHIAFTPKRDLPPFSKLAVPSVSCKPSRESLRNLPSPKPAPSTSLPDPPGATAPSDKPPSARSQLSSSLRPLPSHSLSHPRPIQPKRWGAGLRYLVVEAAVRLGASERSKIGLGEVIAVHAGSWQPQVSIDVEFRLLARHEYDQSNTRRHFYGFFFLRF